MKRRWVTVLCVLGVLVLATGFFSTVPFQSQFHISYAQELKGIQPSQPQGTAWLGAKLYGGDVIGEVFPGSPAANAGLCEGDRVLAVYKVRWSPYGWVLDLWQKPFPVKDISTYCKPGDTVLFVMTRRIPTSAWDPMVRHELGSAIVALGSKR